MRVTNVQVRRKIPIYARVKSAFSDQLLENGRTNFYFSNNEERGYINRLDFRADGRSLKTEDH